MTNTATGTNTWRDWARSTPAAEYRVDVAVSGDPAATAVLVATAGLGDQHVVYERAGVWHVGIGAACVVTANVTETVAGSGDRTWTMPNAGRPLDDIAAGVAELGRAPADGRNVYGWATYELAHLLHGDPASAGREPLIHLMVPDVDIAITPGRAAVVATDRVLGERVAAVLRRPCPVAPSEGVLLDTKKLLYTNGSRYRHEVAAAIDDIRAGRIDKVVLSRPVPLPARHQVDLPASYLAGRRANSPARSFLLDLGGWRAAGFSPETVAEVDADGRVTTQPLAGTRALHADPHTNERLRADLLTDAKEVHEHAISVRLACAELAGVCQPGTVVIEEFMAIRERGSVQHLASRVAGRLVAGESPWSAFAALFPAVTATGAPTAAALAAVTRHERDRRGLYGGAVFQADTDGRLDAALVLRTVFQRGGRTWLRAGAGVMGQSTPDREFEETCEKLRSVAPHLRSAG